MKTISSLCHIHAQQFETELRQFVRGYISAALFFSFDDDGEPLSDRFAPEDIEPDALEEMVDECSDFFQRSYGVLRQVSYDFHEQFTPLELAGHDYFLTRNGHGSGFWDRGFGSLGDALTTAAKGCGKYSLYIGDDGKVWGA